MKPLYNPLVEEMTVQGVLYALSDPTRVRIFMQLASQECSKNCSTFTNICETGAPLPKSTLSQHFKVLREAGLVWSERKGVEVHNRTRCAEFSKKYGAMIEAIIEAYRAECQATLKSSARPRRSRRTG